MCVDIRKWRKLWLESDTDIPRKELDGVFIYVRKVPA